MTRGKFLVSWILGLLLGIVLGAGIGSHMMRSQLAAYIRGYPRLFDQWREAEANLVEERAAFWWILDAAYQGGRRAGQDEVLCHWVPCFRGDCPGYDCHCLSPQKHADNGRPAPHAFAVRRPTTLTLHTPRESMAPVAPIDTHRSPFTTHHSPTHHSLTMPDRIPTYRPPTPPGLSPEGRGNSAQRGYDRRWRRYRKTYLAAHPLCVICLTEGRLTPATEVDHVRAVIGGQKDPLFWAESNHQALCKACHSAKTARERR